MNTIDAHALRIGKLSIGFSSLEQSVSFFIWMLVGEDQLIGQMVTSGMSLSRQLDLLQSLFRHKCKIDELNERLDVIIKKISEVEQKRNRYIHSHWSSTMNEEESLRFKITTSRKRGLAQSKELVSNSELDNDINDLKNLSNELFDFYNGLSIH